MEFQINSMTCGHCVGRVTQAIKALDPQAEVRIDLARHRVEVDTNAASEAVAAALDEAGYPPN